MMDRSTNPYYDMSLTRIDIRPWDWQWIWLWMLPTYVELGEEAIIHWKVFRKHLYITKLEQAPWFGMTQKRYNELRDIKN
jgi:hypothetical protein